MGALRRPDHPSPPLDRPHLALTVAEELPALGLPFGVGVGLAVLGAGIMVAGTSLASAPLVWTALGPLLLACVSLRSGLDAHPTALTLRD